MFGLSPLHLSLVPVARRPDGHVCLGHRGLLRLAGLGGGLALPQSWKWGWGQILREFFLPDLLRKNSSHKKRNRNLTLKISSTQD